MKRLLPQQRGREATQTDFSRAQHAGGGADGGDQQQNISSLAESGLPSFGSHPVGSSLVLEGSGDTIPSSSVLGRRWQSCNLRAPLYNVTPKPRCQLLSRLAAAAPPPAPRNCQHLTSSTPCFSFPLPLWAPLHLCTCFLSVQSCLLTSSKHSRPRPWPLNKVA